jgi:Na+/H+ antiporter NhaD/arsenite permease-like protein
VNPWVTLAIVAVTYVGIAIGRWPLLRCNRATIALVGVGALVVARQVPFAALPDLVDTDTLILLFGMMVINANPSWRAFSAWRGGRCCAGRARQDAPGRRDRRRGAVERPLSQ